MKEVTGCDIGKSLVLQLVESCCQVMEFLSITNDYGCLDVALI
jgi:hypothetical protein